MTIKSTINQVDSIEVITFPCLRVHPDGHVFLFTKHTNGKCSPQVYNAHGEPMRHVYSDADLNDRDMQEKYLPFHGSITLTQD